LKGKSLTEEEELLSVPSALRSEIPLGMVLRVLADWNQRPGPCPLMEGEYVE
jgi:hypothetical protein